ncbi:MAG TPA: hypothetical protein VMH83_01100, partial [Candidatus Acidoferrum sp.]|nr:hypothetical protein [Candidatus Acidoferrum sp.]
GQPFADIRVTPTAQLDRSRNVLLLYTSPEKRQPRRAAPVATDTGSVPAAATASPAATSQPAKAGSGEDGDDSAVPHGVEGHQ